MSVLAAIHARWAADDAITAIVPAEQFTTGDRLDCDDDLPVATVNVEGERKEWDSSKPLRVSTCRLQVWIREHAVGELLQGAVESAFDNTSWTTGGTHVVLSRVENAYPVQEPEGVWQFVFDFEIQHATA